MNVRPRVLLVDSNSDDRALAALVLRRELPDVEVEEVADGMVLADRLPAGGFAAVVTEYRLDWGDGLQVLETVRSLAPDCPVVFFASEGSESVAAHGLRNGLSAYVVKGSAGYVELPAAVRRVIERHTEQRASREGLALFQRLTEELALGTFVAVADGRLTAANLAFARVLGFESEDALVGRNLAEFLSDAALQAQVLASLSRGRTLRDLEAGVRRNDGGLAWVRMALWPVVDPVQGVVRFEGAVEDITGHRKAERELSERAAALGRSNVDLQQFAYVISHDLQEPLQLISRYARLLASNGAGAAGGDSKRYVTNMVQCADRMQVMINDVLAYSRVDTQGRPFKTVDFAELVQQAIGNLKAAIDETGAQVSWDLLPVLAVDGAQMVQLFQNLIGNALKFRRERPAVRIYAVEDSDRVTFAVADNGIGISAEHLERIFGMFQRLHTAAEYPGTGIGLAICKRIVERHGGRIWAVSEVGRGSTFCFTIPRVLKPVSGGVAPETKG
ncbi:MAG: ATP-binding protein [Thermoanaerobaculaceae bacterium]|nr:ATP-binding protein [Thermoanaerobaculaceae bacterium]TAM49966.1 MAG: PAS domain S-box protein [Acidobacteriota bacterium]